MKTVSRFERFEAGDPVTVHWDGAPLDLPEGANLAAALLGAGIDRFRDTPVSGAPRGPFCMMGACFECLVETGGRVQQACMLEVEEGMRIARSHEAEAGDATL